jgi:hypothetical protein
LDSVLVNLALMFIIMPSSDKVVQEITQIRMQTCSLYLVRFVRGKKHEQHIAFNKVSSVSATQNQEFHSALFREWLDQNVPLLSTQKWTGATIIICIMYCCSTVSISTSKGSTEMEVPSNQLVCASMNGIWQSNAHRKDPKRSDRSSWQSQVVAGGHSLVDGPMSETSQRHTPQSFSVTVPAALFFCRRQALYCLQPRDHSVQVDAVSDWLPSPNAHTLGGGGWNVPILIGTRRQAQSLGILSRAVEDRRHHPRWILID